MENNVLLVNSFFITIFVMIVDQMFILNNLTIFQPLSDQYFDSTPINVVKQELDIEDNNGELEDNNEELENNVEKEKPKKKKKSKKNKVKVIGNKVNKVIDESQINLNNEDLYYSNDDYQQQRPERYVDDTYGGRGYDFQEPLLNNDYNFSVDAYNS
jgi:hypothetical protein